MTGKECFLWFCKEWLPRLIGNLLMLLFAGLAVYQFAGLLSGSSGAAVFGVLLAWGYATAAGLLMVRLYLPSVADKITFGLLYPKRFLKTAPVSLSPIHGLITAGNYSAAERQLLDLQKKYPGNAEIAWTLQDLYADRLHDMNRAVMAVRRYLDSRPVRENDLYFRLVVRYAEFLQKQGRWSELKTVLTRELNRNIFIPAEAGIIRMRIEKIQQTMH